MVGETIQVVLITGGTGSFGAAFTEFLLSLPGGPRVRIYSRDEHKQEDLQRKFGQDDRLTFIIGDVRDERRIRRAMRGADAVVHAAALKTVPAGERHADEFALTNITGTVHVKNAAVEAGVKRGLFISSDKAVQAINLYGKTKAVAEDVWIQGNQLSGSRFAVVRGGNVWGSRGSVVEVWRGLIQQHKALPVNDPDTTRFHLPMDEWVRFCWHALTEMHGGEIFTPKLRAWRLGDLAAAFDGYSVTHGSRNGDKQAEYLIAPMEHKRAVNIGWAYVVEPSGDLQAVWHYMPWWKSPTLDVPDYASDCVDLLSIDELKGLIHDDGHHR